MAADHNPIDPICELPPPRGVHFEKFTISQRAALECIGPVVGARRFYLAGGAALSLHIGHRPTEDLDFWTTGQFNPQELDRELSESGVPGTVTKSGANTLYRITDGQETSYIIHPHQHPECHRMADGTLVASMRELALHKLMAIDGRQQRKDYYRSGSPGSSWPRPRCAHRPGAD
jgi:hypothetical protein